MSIFASSGAETCFSNLCQILTHTGNEFREIGVEEAVAAIPEIWKPAFPPHPYPADEVEYNIRSYFNYVAPYLMSAETAAIVSTSCRKALFGDSAFDLKQ